MNRENTHFFFFGGLKRFYETTGTHFQYCVHLWPIDGKKLLQLCDTMAAAAKAEGKTYIVTDIEEAFGYPNVWDEAQLTAHLEVMTAYLMEKHGITYKDYQSLSPTDYLLFQ